jgi:guanylate kinase
MTKKKYKIIALCGESGAGKDFTLNEVIRWDRECCLVSRFHKITHTTTRPPRDNEIDGHSYYFLSLGEYETKRKDEKPIVEVEYKDKWYYSIFEEDLTIDKINIGVFSPAMIEILRTDPRVEVVVVKIAAADKTRLRRQLDRSKNPDVKEIIRRFETDKVDFANLKVDYTLNNEDVDYIINCKYIEEIGRKFLNNFGQFN